MKTTPTILSLLVFAFCQLSAIPGFAEKPGELNELRFEFHVGLAELEKNEPLQELNKKYRGYLDKQKAAYQQAGNLEAMMAVDNEAKSFEDEPGEELSQLPELKRLQGIYREQRKKLESKLNEKKLALIQSSAKKAKELSAKWTREGKLEEARLALEESKRVAAMASDPALVKAVATSATKPTAPAPALGGATATKDKPFKNSLGMKFVPVSIKGGPSDGQSVLFSVWETRVEDYEEFIKDKKNHPWPSTGFSQDDDHPAVNVNWEDAVAFCEWLTERDRERRKIGEDQRYRLPTDHEWSSAVGIGEGEDADQTPQAKEAKIGGTYPWGGKWPPPKGAGNYYGEEAKKNPVPDPTRKPLKGYRDNFDRTAPVGSFEPNEFGLYDLSGNVWEWCADWYSSERKKRVRRGGSWGDFEEIAFRSSMRPNDAPGLRGTNAGFRCVLGRNALRGAR